ncbi:hypothetical protein Tpen_1496 [Thermofilum pendens Hrk 5]|uniref:Uncharacterized protein n=1 Tax=Thermofilum pendens (strain DSM 2475 / Hrk 5) TaxID=368408 RepID=A1S0B3_THEPD|nr:hypothetical protein Tpen_1496 [Thermofilum pendens Hrk 5]
MNALFEDSGKALKAARRELDEYRKTGDSMKLRQAAEKGWLAINKAVEEFLKTLGVEAKTYREKRDALKKLGLNTLRDRFMAREKGVTHRLLLRRAVRRGVR